MRHIDRHRGGVIFLISSERHAVLPHRLLQRRLAELPAQLDWHGGGQEARAAVLDDDGFAERREVHVGGLNEPREDTRGF